MQGTLKHNGKPSKQKMLMAALLSGGAYTGIVTDAPPAQAAGTAANTVISNTASATSAKVSVTLSSLPAATGPGDPTNSYGFIRFRVRVQ